MATIRIPRSQLELARELSLERLEHFATLALSSDRQQEFATNAYYALVFALHYLEITELGYKTSCHTEPIGTELQTTLDGLLGRGILDNRRRVESGVVFHYWIVGYWDGDPGTAHLSAVRSVLIDFLCFFFTRLGERTRWERIRGRAKGDIVSATDEELAALHDDVKCLQETLDVGEW